MESVNVEPVQDDTRPNAVAISEVSPRPFHGIETATRAFIEHVDERLTRALDRDEILAEWRKLSVHKDGDRIHCILGDRTIDGTWGGIDEHGRALIRSDGDTLAVSAADIVLPSA